MFYFETTNSKKNLKNSILVQKILAGIVFTSIIYFTGYAKSKLDSLNQIKNLVNKTEDSKQTISDLEQDIELKKAEYNNFVSKGTKTFEYKKALIQKLSGIKISDNLEEKHLDLMMATADYYQIPYKIYFRLGAKESDNFSSSKSSTRGAMYYFQIMPGTYKQYAKNFPVKKHTIETNIMLSGLILADMHNYYGNWTKAVAAYNAGPDAVDKYNGVPNFKETLSYIKFVMSNNF